MVSRRSILSAGAAMLAAPYPGPAAAAEGPVRLGLVADPQYAPAPPNLPLNRYYSESLWKLREAVDAFNGQDLRFVATLGDVIDRDRASFDPILQVYGRLRHDKVFLLGNHDFSVAAEELNAAMTLLGLERSYYDFAVGGLRFVVLDGNEVSLFAPPPGDPRRELAAERLRKLAEAGAENAKPWNGSLSDRQFAWLGETLAAAARRGERVIVMGHYPIYPANPHNLWDSERVVSLLTAQPHVLAYVCGHNHAGNYGEAGGVHFVNLHGMVDTPTTSAYAFVTVEGARMAIQGFGREPDRTLALKAG